MNPVEGHPGQRVAGWHLHPQQPLQLPPALVADRAGEPLGPLRPVGEQLDRAEELPGGDGSAGHVLPVVAGVIPATRDVEGARTVPPGVEPLPVRPGPSRHGPVAPVRRSADVTGWSAVAGEPVPVNRCTRAEQGEHPEGVGDQRTVELGIDAEGWLTCPAASAEACANAVQTGEVQPVHGQTGGRFGSGGPRFGPPGPDRRPDRVTNHVRDRLGEVGDRRRPHRMSGQIAELVDPDRRPVPEHLGPGVSLDHERWSQAAR